MKASFLICVSSSVCFSLLATAQAGQTDTLPPNTASTQSDDTISEPYILPFPEIPGDELNLVYVPDFFEKSETQVGNGIVVDPSFWTSIFASINELDGKSTSCTSAAIGPSVLLTAAHCVDAKDSSDKGKTKTVLVNLPTGAVSGRCEMHFVYKEKDVPAENTPRSSEDFALCLMNGEFSGINFEVLSNENREERGDPVLVSGYGCRGFEMINGNHVFLPSDGRLRANPNIVSQHNGAWFYTASKNALMPYLCPGDSGGPVFAPTRDGTMEERRRISGVNSAVMNNKTSLYSSTTSTTFREFLTKWLAAHNENLPDDRKIYVCTEAIAGQRNCRP